jgi:hypothetical protein
MASKLQNARLETNVLGGCSFLERVPGGQDLGGLGKISTENDFIENF